MAPTTKKPPVRDDIVLPEVSPERKAYLSKINGYLAMHKMEGTLSTIAEAVKVMLEDPEFLEFYKADPLCPKKIEGTPDLSIIVGRYINRLLLKRDYSSAALVLWGPDVFSPEPRSVKMVWEGLFNSNLVTVMGGSAQGKSYGAAAWVILDWLLDPEYTRIEIMSTDSEHLKKNLWGDIQRLYAQSCIRLPGRADAMSIYASEEAKRSGFGFFVVFAERGKDSKGKLKGGHLRPRVRPHPLFGINSRRRILMDEAQEIPGSTFDDVPNIVAGADGPEHIKVFTAANPKDEFSRYGVNCRPPGGWTTISPLTETWVSETGWNVVRLNAMLSENVKQKRTVFQRMQTWEGVQRVIKAAGGDANAPSVWTFVYGMFPPQGLMTGVVKKSHVDASLGEVSFRGGYVQVFSNDPAYTGDRPAVAVGRAGWATGYTDEVGKFHGFKDDRFVLQVDTVGVIARGDTQAMADDIFSRVKVIHVKPEHFAIDRTGAGQGLHDIIQSQWNVAVDGVPRTDPKASERVAIHGISFAMKPTETTISEEDTLTPKDLYENLPSEMWYASGKLFEFGNIFLGRGVDRQTIDELCGRQGGSRAGAGKKLAVEPKDAYKARGRQSPDLADALIMLVHVVRQAFADFKAKSAFTVITPFNPNPGVFELEMSGGSFQDSEKNVDMWTD